MGCMKTFSDHFDKVENWLPLPDLLGDDTI